MADNDDQVRIRPALPDDHDAIADVWFDSAAAMIGATSATPARGELRSRIDAELASGWALVVAERTGEIVGMLAIQPELAALDQIFVRPSEQGKGIGKALLDEAKRIMPKGFTLRTATRNANARRFYEAQGLTFVEEGVHPRKGTPVCFYRWSAR